MAANLNKKYFGNRNIGTNGNNTTGPLENSQNYGDDRIGGEGIASINFSDAGSWMAVSGTPFSGLTLPAPTLPGGVQATCTFYYGLYAVTTGAGKTGLVVGDIFTYTPYPGSRVTVASTSGSNATFTVTVEGSSTTLLTDTQTVSLTKVSGSGSASTFMVDVFSHIVDVTITEKGSGYTGAETFTTTRTNSSTGGLPAGTIVLTTDNGIPYNANNQENAIIPYAYVTGGSRQVADIIRQVGARRYKVKTATGIMTCSLVTDGVANAAGEMDLTAYDSDGGEYWVKKLGGHRCTVVRKASNGGTQFATDSSVPWTFGSAVEDLSVKINNA